jgi:hypothetical protein
MNEVVPSGILRISAVKDDGVAPDESHGPSVEDLEAIEDFLEAGDISLIAVPVASVVTDAVKDVVDEKAIVQGLVTSTICRIVGEYKSEAVIRVYCDWHILAHLEATYCSVGANFVNDNFRCLLR